MIADAEQKPNNGPVTVSIESDDYNFKLKAREKVVIDCIAWGNAAQTLLNYAGAGAVVAANGRISARTYTDRNNFQRKSQDLVITDVEILEYHTGAPNRAPGYSLVTPSDTSW